MWPLLRKGLCSRDPAVFREVPQQRWTELVAEFRSTDSAPKGRKNYLFPQTTQTTEQDSRITTRMLLAPALRGSMALLLIMIVDCFLFVCLF